MSSPNEEEPKPGWGERMRSIRAASLAGLAFVALMVASLALLQRQPGAEDSAETISEFYLDGGERTLVLIGLNLAPFAAIAFLWFVAAIRRQVGDREDRFFGTVFLASGLLFAASYLGAAVLAAAPVLGVQSTEAAMPSAETLGLIQGAAWGYFAVVGIRFAGVFMIVVSTIGQRTGALPRWLVITGLVLAVALLATVTVSVSEPAGVLFAAWVSLVSIELLLRRSRIRGERTNQKPQADARHPEG